MPIESIVMFVAGTGAVVAGSCVVVFRRQVAARNRKNIENSISERVFPGLGAGSTPARMVPVGIITIVAGLIVIWRSFLS